MRRALLSVSDKTSLGGFGAGLDHLGFELISTGGTASKLREIGLTVTDVAEVTRFPEGMDGRVKTLHPLVHGGILAVRENPAHLSFCDQHGIHMIDLVCVNLYPFTQVITREHTFAEAVENIDIGGPAMLRAAAKNHADVLVVTRPDQYDPVLERLAENTVDGKMRLGLATQAFRQTSHYDAMVAGRLEKAHEEW